ncbi:MAG TPA: glycosyltransferase domain-containing protein [Chitinophagaceae bacterium]
MKKIIYTAIFGDSDSLKEPLKPTPGWDFVCYTDDPNLTSKIWDIEVVKAGDPKKLSRYVKIPNHFPEYDLSIWVDATFQIRQHSLDKFALSKTDGIWLNSHPQRQCLYEEAEVVKSKNLDDPNLIDQQVSKYRQEGYPEQNGLFRCGIMVRNPKDPKITEMCDLWWNEVENGSWRDQISFPYACWKTSVTPNPILHGITQIYFKQSLHKSHPTEDWTFVGEGQYDAELTKKYDTAHLIILRNGILFPTWLRNYINPKVGKERFAELVKILNGITVHG